MHFWTQVYSALITQQILCTCTRLEYNAQVWLRISVQYTRLNKHLRANTNTVSGPDSFVTFICQLNPNETPSTDYIIVTTAWS
jgi:hypothetical protein